jgi:hypothetical protein
MHALDLAERRAAQVDDYELRDCCFELVAIVKEETSCSNGSLAGEFLALLRGGEPAERTKLTNELVILAMLKAVSEV